MLITWEINEAHICLAHANNVQMNELPLWTNLDVNDVLQNF